MGLYNLDNPGRAGFDAAQYDGWALTNIINDFVKRGLDIENNRVLLRKAILVSNEYRMVSKGVRFNV